jgi:hypothetical protein
MYDIDADKLKMYAFGREGHTNWTEIFAAKLPAKGQRLTRVREKVYV